VSIIVGGCSTEPAEPGARRRPPNVILIVADDLGFGDVGIFGSEVIETPHIDALARGGARFTSAYVAAAVCGPSRAALMTGRYPQRFGYHFNDNEVAGLPLTERTLAEHLHSAGYATGLIGKWQLGWAPDHRPNARGFDEFYGIASASIYIDPNVPGVESWSAVPLPERRLRPIFRNDEPVVETDYLTDAFTREAISFIDRHEDQPFFLYLAHFAPHTPLQATSKYIERYRNIEPKGRRIFAAMVSAIDESIGVIEERLATHGIARDTLVIFLSDNGCALYSLGTCSNRPLNGGKRYYHDGGVRVPFILSWPGHVSPTVRDEAVSALDIVPTVLAAAGVKAQDGYPLDGVDLVAHLERDSSATPHRDLFWRAGPNRAARVGDWKLWQVNRADPARVARTPQRKLFGDWVAPGGSPLGQLTLLYDLSNDIGERRNLAARRPDVVRRIKAALDRWDSEMKPPSVDSTRGTWVHIAGEPVELIF